MKLLRSLQVQFSLIIVLAILIPVSVISYFAVAYHLEEANFAKDTERQLTDAVRELEPLFQQPGLKEDELTKLAPSVNSVLRSYMQIRVSYFNGSTFYTFGLPRGKTRSDGILVSTLDDSKLAEFRSDIANKTELATKEIDGDFPGYREMEAVQTVGQGKQGLLVLNARVVPFFLENRVSRQAVVGSLLLGLVLGIIGVLLITRRLQKGITKIQGGLESATINLEIPLESQSGELGLVVNSINQMRQELVSKRQLEEQLQRAERLAGLGKLTAGVAHEIRNPLGIMKGTIQLMERAIKSEPALAQYQEHMKVLQEQINRQNKVVEELLSYARPVKPRFGPVSISGMIESVLSFLSPSLRQQGISLTTELEPGLPTVPGDGEKLKQVLVNLLINSKEALQQGGKIHISAAGSPGWVEIKVADNGAGIAAECLSQIFEPFFSTKEAGTGLGLSIAKQIIELHQGEIGVSNLEQGGVCFTIRIPTGGDNNADNFSN